MKHGLLLAACVLADGLSAQVDLPVFGKQQVINGYAKDIEGEVLSYFSVYPEHATTALLTRCTDGKKSIAWETAPTPKALKSDFAYFSWIAAHNSTTSGGDRSFDLLIGEEKVLTFTTHHSTQPATWSVDGVDGVKLVFEYSKMDRHGDAHGFAHLRVPRNYITPGQALRLKVVGHAQNSPDWFMTFRYTFEEKVELEVLPFVLRSGARRRPIQLTVVRSGAPTELIVDVTSEFAGFSYSDTIPVRHGFQVIESTTHGDVLQNPKRLRARLGGVVVLDTMIQILVPHERKIHLIHHSHNDIGYSHLQSEVEVIQNRNIWKALELIDRTKDYPEGSRFVWNVESLWAVENFLGIASEVDKQRFIAAVKGGSIALSANYANILTGLCTPEEMHWIVEYADSLRKWYDLPINSAMQTDIPGMSWSMVDAYAAHGIRYLSQGPNYIPDLPDGGDRIGSTLREQGDKPYWWRGTTGRDSILVWTAGQGYGGWHGFTPGAIKERGTRKIAAYMNELAAKGYPYDMVQWRYNIVSDNGPVDSTLSDFVREWNSTYASPRLIIANAGTMMQEFERKYGKDIPTWSGDFTPYWEDGAYSTAKEEGEMRVLSARLTNLIDAAKILGKPIDPHLLYRAKRSIVLWHEHTWGAWCSISDPDSHFTTDQWRVKKAFADSAGWYIDEVEHSLRPAPLLKNEVVSINTLGWERYSIPKIKPFDPDLRCVTNPLGHLQYTEKLSDGRLAFRLRVPDKAIISTSFSNSRSPGLSVLSSVYTRWTGSTGAYRVLGGIRADTSDSSVDGLLEWQRQVLDGKEHNEWPQLASYKAIDQGELVNDGIVHVFLNGTDSITTLIDDASNLIKIRTTVYKRSVRDKESLHLALPFNIPNATVRIGISDTCVTPESGRIPGSNNDFFCAQRWIDVSNDSMGVTIVCPQGALWEVGEMVDERKVNPGKGTNPEMYKAWKTEAKSSSTIYLYALNNYWHTNFKADQEGPITFDLYLKMHGPFKLEDARRFGLEMTRPLITWWK